jgi:hypothetical protein
MVLEDAVEPGLGGNGEVECYRVSGFDWIPVRLTQFFLHRQSGIKLIILLSYFELGFVR